MSKRVFGYAAFEPNGFLVGTFHAFNIMDVERALKMEWNKACSFTIERTPKNTVGYNELSRDRFYDLTSPTIWDELKAENEEDNNGIGSPTDHRDG